MTKTFTIPSGVDRTAHIFIRQALPVNMPKAVVVLLHGATLPSIIFDLKAGKETFLEYLAGKDFAAYSLDYRGYGWSSKPKEMDEPPIAGIPLITHVDACHDVQDLLCYINKIHKSIPISLCGFSWGSTIAGVLATQQQFHKLILLGPVYSHANPSWQELCDKNDPLQLSKGIKNYRIMSRARWHKPWDAEIPSADKSLWRDPELLKELCDDVEASDARWAKVSGCEGSIRVPTGVLHDAHRVHTRRPLYDAAKITCPTLILRGELDGASQDEDMQGLFAKMQCPKQRIDISKATHYGVLEKKAESFYDAVVKFLE